jgi:hypothetical protein
MTPEAQDIVLATLRRDGIARLPLMLAASEVRDLRDYLATREVWNAHVQAKARASQPCVQACLEGRWPMFCHAMADVIAAPHLFAFALTLTDLVAAYLGEEPLLYSVNAFWTQPASGPRYGETHGWHRDGDDRKFLVLFAYGTDVLRAEHGAHLFGRGSHQHQLEGAPPPETVETVCGAAGTMFLADTRGLHQGLRPDRQRLLFWVRWGVSEPPASYRWDKLAPVAKETLPPGHYPAAERLRRSLRLVVQ